MMKNSSLLTRPESSLEMGHEIARPEVVELEFSRPSRSKRQAAWINSSAKRALDLVFTLLILPLAFPFFLLVALAIRLESRGPIFFLHRRLGQDGSVFRIFKFRTMVDGADQILTKLLDSDLEARQEFAESYKLKNDPRVTRLGRFLRRSSLDELPQMINVLKGELSWVGPRPIVVSEIQKYGRQGARLLRMKPGITGLWQASGRSDLPYEDRIRLDMEYLGQASIWLDIKIILQTVVVVLNRTGAI
jgi:lipopolysaccharide/colanic/teichoic acid biosynthesis glycosyltransferase